MKKVITISMWMFLLSGNFFSAKADTPPSIEGKNIMQIDETLGYSVPGDPGVTEYRWIAPTGCRIVEGQGTASVRMASTFLAQDGTLQVERAFGKEKKDTLKTAVTFCRHISSYVDHSINPGESITVNGKEYTEADIYYEPAGEGDEACKQVIAHRLTVVPTTFESMTRPYLQTATSTSVWITWKTDFSGTPVASYGKEENNLSSQTEGTAQKLSEAYYWNSVQLTGLEPNTAYYYRVRTGEKESETYRFRTMPAEGGKQRMRILLMGDHQIKSRSGYEWLMQAAKRKIEEKYGNLEDNINMIMNVGDQVDVGTLEQYEHIHLFKSRLMSPYLPIMTAVGNHETYSDPGMITYAAHYHYEDLEYKGIKSGTENYYAYQAGRILFVVLSTEHTGNDQKQWVRKVTDAAKNDEGVDFIISVNHRPIQAEQYIGDISAWVRNEIVPILSETDKHIFNYGGHHHLYHRGQLTDYPLYHIINGAASWDQMWGMSSEKDYDDVQKTIDYWGYQILEFDFDKKEMKAECYAIGNKELVTDNILIDSFHRTLGKAAPEKPEVKEMPETIELPYTFCGSPYATQTDEKLNTVQFQFSLTPDFSTLEMNSVRDVENLYGSTGRPLHIPTDLNENADITTLTVGENKLKNGTYYVRLRYRDANMEWSPWSDSRTFTVTGSIDGDPAISMTQKTFALGQEFTVSYQYVPEGQNAWIGIYHKGEKPGTGAGTVVSTRWGYTVGQSGTLTFTLDKADEYFAVLFEDEGYTEAAPRIAFYVGTTPELTIDKTVYTPGEPVRVTYRNAPGLASDWIGIYKMGKTPGTSDLSDSWAYTPGGSAEGEMALGAELGKGYYFINYFTRGMYFEPTDRLYFSIGEKISSVSADKNTFTEDEEINIYYKDGPGTPKDWVGFFLEGKDPDKDELDGFYYTYGATEGYITVKPGELPAGDYFCALYINDSYDEVSERIHISIRKGGATSVGEERQAKAFYPNPVAETLFIENECYHTATILSTTGETVRICSLQPGTNALSMSDMPAGMYLLKLQGQEKEGIFKIVKKN